MLFFLYYLKKLNKNLHRTKKVKKNIPVLQNEINWNLIYSIIQQQYNEEEEKLVLGLQKSFFCLDNFLDF